MAVLLKTALVRVSFIQIMQVRVQNKGKSVWKSRYVGDVSPAEADCPTHFLVKDLVYLPHIIYHILRHTLYPIKGHSSSTKLEGTMKTLVYYVLNNIRLNTHDFFIRQLANSGIDLLGLKLYAPGIMRLIKLHSAAQYQPSSATIISSRLKLMLLMKLFILRQIRLQLLMTMLHIKDSQAILKLFVFPILLLLVYLLVKFISLFELILMQPQTPYPKGLRSVHAL